MEESQIIPIVNDIYTAEYDHIKELGRGGGGIVYKCKSKFDGQVFAVKLVPLCDDCEKEIFPEMRALFLIHPNILRCYKAWVENTFPAFASSNDMKYLECTTPPTKFVYLLMEECEGNLASLSSQKNYNAEHIFRDCVEGLKYLHSKDLIHGDISSNNIFVDSKGTAKIGDFGCVVEADGVPRPIGGVQIYHAPEVKAQVFEETGVITKASDVYSLALVITEVIYDVKTDAEKVELFSKIKNNRKFPEQTKISNQHLDILCDMLNAEPIQRPDAEAILNRM